VLPDRCAGQFLDDGFYPGGELPLRPVFAVLKPDQVATGDAHMGGEPLLGQTCGKPKLLDANGRPGVSVGRLRHRHVTVIHHGGVTCQAIRLLWKCKTVTHGSRHVTELRRHRGRVIPKGDRLATFLRTARGLDRTQEEIAQAAGIDRTLYNAYENGRRGLEEAKVPGLAAALGVTEQAFLDLADPDLPQLRDRLEEVEALARVNEENLNGFRVALEDLGKGIEARLDELESRVRGLGG